MIGGMGTQEVMILALGMVVYLGVLAIFVGIIVVHLAIGIRVYNDAKELTSPAMEFPPWVWSLLSFSVPAVGLLCYWLLNHSTLTKD